MDGRGDKMEKISQKRGKKKKGERTQMWKLWKEQQTFPGQMDTKTEGAHVSP